MLSVSNYNIIEIEYNHGRWKMGKTRVINGNEACSLGAYPFTEVASIYPITPSSAMAEMMDELSSKGQKNIFNDVVKVVEMQSEAGAAGLMHGSLQMGCLTTTFTSSQGLLLMIPNIYKMAGELLPGVIHVAARSLSTHALSIFGDHQDIYATRMSGIAILASSSVEEAYHLAVVAHLASMKGRLPFLHFFDGFRTSHELQKVTLLPEEKIKGLVDMTDINRFRKRSLASQNNVSRGVAQNEDAYFQNMEARNKYYLELPATVNFYMQQLNKLTNKNYAPFVYYGVFNAEKVIIAMGSVTETIKETVDYLNKEGYQVGVIIVHLYRPFSKDYFLSVLPKSVKKIAVLDRTKEPGSIGEPLYLDVVGVFQELPERPVIIGGRYGLSSKDTNLDDIKAVFDFLDQDNYWHGFTVGISDDVTRLSLPIVPSNYINHNVYEIFIYGYGSDGMVSTSEDILKIVGDNTNHYVQGYFQYDSRKSGGVTRSHLRFSKEPIRLAYGITTPHMVVCTKDSYLDKYDMLSGIREQGIFLLNTMSDEEAIKSKLSPKIKKVLGTKKIKFYVINANELARKLGLGNKISTILESVIFRITNIMDNEKVRLIMVNNIKQRFRLKGEDIIRANEEAIMAADQYIKEIKVDDNWSLITTNEEELDSNFITAIEQMEGNKLPTSAFIDSADGSFTGGTTKNEKRAISDFVPEFIKDNCIECNQCSFVCPHAVIRPFLLNEEELAKAPKYIKENAKELLDSNFKQLRFIVMPSIFNCTGCGVCVNTCPGRGKTKALMMKPFSEQKAQGVQEAFDYLVDQVTYKNIINTNTVKGSQFLPPYFQFNGACGGCGQPAYIKLITQLYGDKCIIVNATGCSSIYGASLPNLSYTIPWASSLFEDNAEYGYGMIVAHHLIRERIKKVMLESINVVDLETKDLYEEWLAHPRDYNITNKVYHQLKDERIPKELIKLKTYIPARAIWIIGGDGWAYDIGFGGLDHVLSTNDNINILVLDSQIYSNTGGQTSKATAKGAISKFAGTGKTTAKKDLARMMLSYPHVYVATVSIGYNMQQYIKAVQEAENYQGPAIIIAYTPCIGHGIKGGLTNSIKQEKLATACGYFPIFRFNPTTQKLYLDSPQPNFDLYEEFLNNETRYSMLKVVNPDKAHQLLQANKEEAIRRFNYYQRRSTEEI